MRKATVRVTIDLPFVIRLPDGDYSCRLGEDEFTIRLELVARSEGEPEGSVGVIVAPLSGKVTVPPRTRLSVAYGLCTGIASGEGLGEERHAQASRFLNAFIDSYRFLFQDPLVYTLSSAEFFAVRYDLAPRYVIDERDESGHGKVSFGVTFGDQPLQIVAWKHTEDDLRKFREFVKVSAQPPLTELLVLSAKGHQSRGEYRFAIIEAATALDVTAEEVARRLLMAEGKTERQALGVLGRSSTKQIVDTYIQPRISEDFVGCADWKKYDSALRELRNSVVHDALEPSRGQGDDFLRTVEALIERLRALTASEIRRVEPENPK